MQATSHRKSLCIRFFRETKSHVTYCIKFPPPLGAGIPWGSQSDTVSRNFLQKKICKIFLQKRVPHEPVEPPGDPKGLPNGQKGTPWTFKKAPKAVWHAFWILQKFANFCKKQNFLPRQIWPLPPKFETQIFCKTKILLANLRKNQRLEEFFIFCEKFFVRENFPAPKKSPKVTPKPLAQRSPN